MDILDLYLDLDVEADGDRSLYRTAEPSNAVSRSDMNDGKAKHPTSLERDGAIPPNLTPGLCVVTKDRN